MEEPKITQIGSGIKIRWNGYDLTAEVTRMRPRGDDIKAEVQWMFQGSELKRSNVTTSENGMDVYERRMKKRLAFDDYSINLSQILEDLRNIIVDATRNFEDAVKLKDVPVSMDGISWKINNLLIDGGITVIYADGASGKSYLSLFLAVLCQESYANDEHKLVVKPGNSLFIDWETEADKIAMRERKIINGLGIENPKSCHYLRARLPLLDEIDNIQDQIEANDIDLIVIDSMGYAMSGELEKQPDVSEFFRNLNRIRRNDGREITKLLISHVTKKGELFGSAYVRNSARLVWEIQKDDAQGFGTNSIDITLFCEKVNDVSEQPPQSWRMEFEPDSVKFLRKDTYDTDQRAKLSYSKLVYEILEREGPMEMEPLVQKIAKIKKLNKPADEADVKDNVASAVSKHIHEHDTLERTEIGLLILKNPGGESPVAVEDKESPWEL